MNKVWEKIKGATLMSSAEFAKQYVTRDLLNLAFGNSDNHGRNISFLKTEGDIRFAPIYDFAPMKADPEMVTRLFKWGRHCESSGHVNFRKVSSELTSLCPPQELIEHLQGIAEKLIDIPNILSELECPIEIIEFPAIGFNNIESKLTAMGVLNG